MGGKMNERVNILKFCIFIILFISFINPSSSQTANEWISKGYELYESGEYDKAVDAFIEAIAIDSNNTFAWTYKGLSLDKLGEFDKATEAYDRAIATSQTATEYNNIGFALLQSGKYVKAIEAYDKAIAINPNDIEPWLFKGESFEGLGEYEKAIDAWNKAIDLDPNLEMAWSGKGLVLAKLGEYNKAIEAYDRVIAINPKDKVAWSIKGLSFYKLGKYDKSIEAYDRAIAIDPNDKYTWLFKGNALYGFGEYKKAIEAYDKALAIDPSFKNATESKELALKRGAEQTNAQYHEQGKWSLFWKSIIIGTFSLSYLEVWIAGILYGIFMFAFLFAASRLSGEEIGFKGSVFYMVGSTVFQGILMALIVAYLTPLLLFGNSTAPMSWIIANIGTIMMIGIVSIIIAIIVGSIPISIFFFLRHPIVLAFLQGVIIFRFLSEYSIRELLKDVAIGTDIYPGLLESIGFLIVAYLISILFVAISYLTLFPIFKKIMPSKNDKNIEDSMEIILIPLIGLFAMLPVFMYISYVRITLAQLLP